METSSVENTFLIFFPSQKSWKMHYICKIDLIDDICVVLADQQVEVEEDMKINSLVWTTLAFGFAIVGCNVVVVL